jgi:hypothetical protein
MIEIAYLIFIATGSALLSDALDDFMQPNMIFHKYRLAVEKLGFWGKPLGACVQCFNVWVLFLLMASAYIGIDIIWQVGISIGIANFTLKKILQ